MVEKMSLYTPVHKGQRRWLFEFAVQVGRADLSDREAVGRLESDLRFFIDHIKVHAGLEERFIHPRLGVVVPGDPRAIEADHEIIHIELEELLQSVIAVEKIPVGHVTLPQLSQELYLATSRFISFYLKHIDFEEEHVQQILLNCCTAEELNEMFTNIIRAQTQKQLQDNLTLMFRGMNVSEIIGLLSTAKSLVPATAYQGLLAQAESLSEPARWLHIKSKLA